MKYKYLAIFCLLSTTLFGAFYFRDMLLGPEVYPNETIEVDGMMRQYRLVVPCGLEEPAPLVFAFHGVGDTPEEMSVYADLDPWAADNGAVLVYPAAEKKMWKTVDVDPESLESHIDVRLFDELLESVCKRCPVDRNRVYIIGMSNGASFVQLLASMRSDEIAAAVVHSGSQPDVMGEFTNPMPIMMVVGENDLAYSYMREEADAFESNGHPVEFVAIPDWGHRWSIPHNPMMWDFLAGQTLED